jgi:hypothetical protein
VDALDRLTNWAPGWSEAMAKRLKEHWERWHLNDMTAGSPVQEAFLRANPIKAVYPVSDYEEACKALAEAGLNPDPNHLHKGEPYRYGTAWLTEEVPPRVIEWLFSLPNADRELPGSWGRD